jgi:hypothetical protein
MVSGGGARKVPVGGRTENGGSIMFRIGLLTSTAMTAVALLLSGAPHEAQAQTAMHVADRDANARFLCTYGEFGVSFQFSGQSSYLHSTWERVAVPVTGHGQTVSRIIVMEAQDSRTRTDAFLAGIYSNSPSGFPGKRIAGGKGRAGRRCGPVEISIPPTTLKPKTKYWIEEKAGHATSYTSLYWATNPNTKRKAYVQTHKRTCSSSCSSSTSPWTKQSQGPWFKLK